jgi:hypothetical protein
MGGLSGMNVIIAIVISASISAFLGYKYGIKRATDMYSQEIRDILVAALSSDFIEGLGDDTE